MKYFYLREADGYTLLDGESDGEIKIKDLTDSRIVPDSIQEFTRYSGWLEFIETEPLVPETA